MSPPAQNGTLPSLRAAPRTSTALIAGSRAQALSLSFMAIAMAVVSALSAAGRLSVTVPRPPRASNRTSSVAISSLSAQQAPGDDEAHDLVRALENLVHAHVAYEALDREVLQVTIAAVELERGIAHREAHVGGEALGHGNPAGLEDHHGGRLTVPAELLFRFAEGEAGRILLDRKAGDAARALEAGAHHGDIHIRDAGARDDRFGAVGAVGRAAAHRAGLERGGPPSVVNGTKAFIS